MINNNNVGRAGFGKIIESDSLRSEYLPDNDNLKDGRNNGHDDHKKTWLKTT